MRYAIVTGDELVKYAPVIFIDHDDEDYEVLCLSSERRDGFYEHLSSRKYKTLDDFLSTFSYFSVKSDDASPEVEKAFELIREKILSPQLTASAALTDYDMIAIVESAIAASGDDWRSKKAKLQRRDRKGRFAYMGGMFKFPITLPDGRKVHASGKIVGQSGTEDVDVEVIGDKNVPDGVYSVPSKSGENVKAVLKSAGKSKPPMFRRGRDAAKPALKDKPVDGGIARPDTSGLLSSSRVMIGDGSINTQEDANSFVKNGGALADIPNEFVMGAIFANLQKKSSTEPQRFRAISGGGKGINGMLMLKDTSNASLLGVKYRDGSSKWYETFAGYEEEYIARQSGEDLEPYDRYREALNEVFAERLSEILGFEPMPMRIIGSLKRRDGSQGISLITELAQNKWKKLTNPFDMDTMDENLVRKVSIDSFARMRLLDMLIGNVDRHDGNYVLADREDGTYEIVPIDNSLSLIPRQGGDGLFAQDMPDTLAEYDQKIAKENWEDFVKAVEDALEALKTINLDDLSKFYNELVETVDSIAPGILTDELLDLDNANMLNTLVSRIVTALETSPERLARILSPSKHKVRLF